MFKRKSPARELLMLLKQERVALTSGKIDELNEILSKKETALKNISDLKESIHPEILQEISENFSFNQMLNASAQRGLSAAIRNLNIIRNPEALLDTYDVDGRVTSKPFASTNEKRV